MGELSLLWGWGLSKAAFFLSFWWLTVWFPQTKCDTDPSAKMQAEDSNEVLLSRRAADRQGNAGMHGSRKNNPICGAWAGGTAGRAAPPHRTNRLAAALN